MKEYAKDTALDVLWMFLGTAIMAVAVNCFFTPVNLVTGGFSGLGIIIRHLTDPLIDGGVPLWVSNTLLNIPLLLAALKLKGWKFIGRTVIASAFFSLNLYWIPVVDFAASDLLMSSIIGGALQGFGLGIVLQARSTTGGTDTLAALVHLIWKSNSVAQICAVLDGIVIALSIFIFGIQITMYGLIAVYLSGKVSDNVLTGTKNARLVYIISENSALICSELMDKLERGATMLHGKGAYTSSERDVLMIAVSKKELVSLKEIVSDIDPNAFMIVGDAREIRGEGFESHRQAEL